MSFLNYSRCWPYLSYGECEDGIVYPVVFIYLATAIVCFYIMAKDLRSSFSKSMKRANKSAGFWAVLGLSFLIQIIITFYVSPSFVGVHYAIAVFVKGIPFVIITGQSITASLLLRQKQAKILNHAKTFINVCLVGVFIVLMYSRFAMMFNSTEFPFVLVVWLVSSIYEIASKLFFIATCSYVYIFNSEIDFISGERFVLTMKFLVFITSFLLFLWLVFQGVFNLYVINVSLILRGFEREDHPNRFLVIPTIHVVHFLVEYLPQLILMLVSIQMAKTQMDENSEDSLSPVHKSTLI